MLNVAPIPCPEERYQAPAGFTLAVDHNFFSSWCVPELSPRDTKGAWASANRFIASTAPFIHLILAGSSDGPTIRKSLCITRSLLVNKPSATYFFSESGACTRQTSASPLAPNANAWPVPTEITFTVEPVFFSNMGTRTSNNPESCVLVVVERMTACPAHAEQ